MKKALWYALIICLSYGSGWFMGQQQTLIRLMSNKNFNLDEVSTIKELREKCKIADKKNSDYFKKYGTRDSEKDLVHDEEFTAVGEWEQACSDTFEILRDQFRDEK